MIAQPQHCTEAGLETWMMQAEFVRLIRAADVFDIQHAFAREKRIQMLKDVPDIPIEIVDMQIRRGARGL